MQIIKDESTQFSKSLSHLVSPRGADNFFGRIINGTDKIYSDEVGTLSVSVAPNGRYTLVVHNPFFEACSPEMRKLGLVHEAAHLALRHLERLFRIFARESDPVVRAAISAIYNVALDFAANDAVVRREKEFSSVHQPLGSDKGEWHFLLPEEYGFPAGESAETYVRLMLPKAGDVMKRLQAAAQQVSEGIPASGDALAKGPLSRRAGGPGDSDHVDVPPALVGASRADAEVFEAIKEAFDQVTQGNHAPWNDVSSSMTPDDASSMAGKLKQDARSLVRAARDQTERSRGTVPGYAEQLVKRLLEEDRTPWDSILSDVLSSSVVPFFEEAMKAPNLAMINDENFEPWPGLSIDFAFHITWINDVSGSRTDPEYARALRALNGLLAQNKAVVVTYLECDAVLYKEEQADNLQPPDPQTSYARSGYGGTVYAPAFRRILNLDTDKDWARPDLRPSSPHPKPDLVVVCTDGGVTINGECFPQYHPGCPIVWLIDPYQRPAPGMDNVAPDRVIQMFEIRPEF